MADQKISELTALTGANVADDDAIAIVDTSATETKKIVFSELKTALDSATGFVRITGDTMTGALDVQSTITADGLTVDGGANLLTRTSSGAEIDVLEVRNNATAASTASAIKFVNSTAAGSNSGSTELVGIRTGTNTGDFKIRTSNSSAAMTDRMLIDSNGDISFYEDTGTTAKLTWDASDESLNFADNGKAIFGAGSDLEIYHDGSNSYIKDLGTGNLIIDGTNLTIRDSNTAKVAISIQNNSNEPLVQLRYDNATKLATESGGVNITGVLTSDGLTVDGDVTVTANLPTFTITGQGRANGFEIAGTSGDTTLTEKSNNGITLGTNNTSRLRIQNNGDISFYEDQGTTPKFFWDASAESVNIGDIPASIDGLLAVRSNANSHAITIYEPVGANENWQVGVDADGDLGFYNSSSTTASVTFDDSGNVGIGTSSPSFASAAFNGVEISYSTIPTLRLTDTSNTSFDIFKNGLNVTLVNRDAGYLRFDTSNTERMRISADGSCRWTPDGSNPDMTLDASGNLLVGGTDTFPHDNAATSGTAIGASGYLSIARSGGISGYFNRMSSDGDIVQFRKNGSTVGSIGTSGDDLTVGNDVTTLKFHNGLNTIHPNGTGSGSDGFTSLGWTNNRFDDIYATNGTIQTSDQNEKQDIAELTDAEQRVAVAAKGLLRKFRWRDAVEAKGDEARTHFGIIAQDLQAAFAAEGLDAGDYAMFISSNWTDEETGEERTRMGVRYSELLAFIIAAI